MSEPEKKKLIGIISPCFNEEKNVELLYTRIKEVFEGLPQYDWELTYIDNSSSDQTIEILRRLAKADKRVRAIINVRN
ncbi:glycosyltransferase, partial [Acinetobacter baumannii]